VIGVGDTRPANGADAARFGPHRPLPTGGVFRLACQDDPDLEFLVYIPRSGVERAPVFVTVHGISRNVVEHATLFTSCCEAVGAVLVAPYFPYGAWADYQRLGRLGRGPRADAALDRILDEITRKTGAATDRIHIHGFSGGAQFAHRYTMAHPHRVDAAVISAAGWYTFPDWQERFPYGIRRSRDLPDVHFDPEEFLQVPITVLVGDHDVTDIDLRCTKRVARQQGVTRLERARNWVDAMHAVAGQYRLEPRVRLETIPGGDHSFADLMVRGGLGARVFLALFGARTHVANGDG
jgi:dienelactone hydrolase